MLDLYLLRIIDQNGEEIYKYKYAPLKTHIEGYNAFSKLSGIPLSYTSNDAAATGLISRGYISLENIRYGYSLFLPKECSKEQIDYLMKRIPYFRKLEEKDRLFNVGIYQEDPVYYNHKKYRDLSIEEEINSKNENREKRFIADVLLEELNKQLEKTHRR